MIDIVYYSEAIPGLTSEDITNILKTAREFNSKNNITGCLLFHNGKFLQILEGEKEIVYELLEAIKKDKRHSNIIVMVEDLKDKRIFPDWNMAFHDFNVNESEEIDLLKDIPSFEMIVQKPTNAVGLFWTMAQFLAMD